MFWSRQDLYLGWGHPPTPQRSNTNKTMAETLVTQFYMHQKCRAGLKWETVEALGWSETTLEKRRQAELTAGEQNTGEAPCRLDRTEQIKTQLEKGTVTMTNWQDAGGARREAKMKKGRHLRCWRSGSCLIGLTKEADWHLKGEKTHRAKYAPWRGLLGWFDRRDALCNVISYTSAFSNPDKPKYGNIMWMIQHTCSTAGYRYIF